ncbi:hypothetical protein [Brachyspira pilosicoli]|uniref:Uncharacterized protein n=1 Tax=Brachyspira pilosicoli TaxID=52584 RepID=A0AAJ6G934_BRAPL|nr:hypothetical protein [Brachyspira pilosicoli]WIH90966.1 hypothetical protein NEI02_03150 [Brachyspira pilosicoli]WIH93257.1 hypothetical protein NEI01_03150 [Brachyspira pilosicoli]WIH95547.1 hypothetical protein NEH99_03145 [Brachyspira pilosicoli]
MGYILIFAKDQYENQYEFDCHIFNAKTLQKSNNTISVKIIDKKSICKKKELKKLYEFNNLQLSEINVNVYLPVLYDNKIAKIYHKEHNKNIHIYYAEKFEILNELGLRIIASLYGREVCGTCLSSLYKDNNYDNLISIENYL